MSFSSVKEYFKKNNMEKRIYEFEDSSATVELASKALKCEIGRIAKSLSFIILGIPTIIVTAGDVKVSNSKFKQQFNTKAKMLVPEDVEVLIGHKVGGVCPFALNDGVDVYLDISLKKYETVFPACGSSNSAIELTISELERFSNFKEWIDIGQDEV